MCAVNMFTYVPIYSTPVGILSPSGPMVQFLTMNMNIPKAGARAAGDAVGGVTRPRLRKSRENQGGQGGRRTKHAGILTSVQRTMVMSTLAYCLVHNS